MVGYVDEVYGTLLSIYIGAGRRGTLDRGRGLHAAGKRAIVLGGTSGIGLAATNQLASEGVSVIAASRQPQRAQGSVRPGVELQVCDVQDREALRALFAASAPFDILVNAATGGPRAMGPFLQMDLDGYRGSFAKLWGYTNSVRLAAEHMDERGTIVLVSGTPARRAKSGQVSLASVGAVEAFAAPWPPNWPPSHQRRVPWDYRYPDVWG